MKAYFGRWLVGLCCSILMAQPVQAFFCFNFAFGSNDNPYRGLPPIIPPAHHAPHPSSYLANGYNAPYSPTANPRARYYPGIPAHAAGPGLHPSAYPSPIIYPANQTK